MKKKGGGNDAHPTTQGKNDMVNYSWIFEISSSGLRDSLYKHKRAKHEGTSAVQTRGADPGGVDLALTSEKTGSGSDRREKTGYKPTILSVTFFFRYIKVNIVNSVNSLVNKY